MKEFEGKLGKILPKHLISSVKSNDFDNFFLVLGLIFNDLKGLTLFLDLFYKNYRQPKPDGSEPVSVHLGQWSGVQNHLNRLMISFISEFLVFLDKNRKIFDTIEFRLFEKSLPRETRQDWIKILRVLDGKGKGSFLSEIAQVRSTVTFHYDHSLTELRKGFVKKFFDSPQNEYNERAFYSLGETMETTRFYYCDGAVEEYLKSHMESNLNSNYTEKIKDLIIKTNHTIRFMMEAYLDYKKQKI